MLPRCRVFQCLASTHDLIVVRMTPVAFLHRAIVPHILPLISPRYFLHQRMWARHRPRHLSLLSEVAQRAFQGDQTYLHTGF